MRHPKYTLLLALLFFSISTYAQKDIDVALKELESKSEMYRDIAFKIWDWAEIGFQEKKSSDILQKTLKDAGFAIESGVAGMPTAFVAEYGSGYPVIAILGEFDALPGLSQKAVPVKESADGIAGHACGHHLFGTASAGTAIAVKNWMIANKPKSGTVRFYGCPAEEGGSGKVYMVREGLFDDVDVALHWHPDEQNDASAGAALSIKSVKFKFHGSASHAAWSPHRGRSALDAVEAMNFMVNLMREHIPDAARVHYAITNGGSAPNIVPNLAEVYYYIRHNNNQEVQDLFERIKQAGEGAALGTGTTMEVEVTGGSYEMLPNLTIQKLMYDNLVTVGGVEYTAKEKEFAEELIKTLQRKEVNYDMATRIPPYRTVVQGYGSTDVGDVSFMAPTAGVYTATWVPGTPAHSWQATACGRTTIAEKGMINAAKVMTMTAIQLFKNPDLVAKAKEEFEERRGKDFKYVPLIGDKAPELDYMTKSK